MKSSNKQVLITNNQFWILIAITIWPAIIGYGGGIMAREAGRDMWMGGIFASFGAIVLALIMIFVGRKFSGQTVVEYAPKLLGLIPGKFLGIILCSYFFLGALISVTIYIHHINDFMLPETPFMVLTIIHVAVVCYFVWHGPEVIARVSVVGFGAAMFFNALVFVATLQEIDLDRILPLFDQGFLPTVAASSTAISFISPNVFVIAMILPLIKLQGKTGRSAAAGVIIGAIFFTFYFVAELMVMGPDVTAQMRVACMDLVRSLEITRYLHRFESFMVVLWYWSMLVQAGILAHCAVLAFHQTAGLKKFDKLTIIIVGVLLISLTYVLGYNRTIFLNFIERLWQYMSLPVEVMVPIILILLTLIRKPDQK